jgi:hypothetical protein
MSQFPVGFPGIGTSLNVIPIETFDAPTEAWDFLPAGRPIDGTATRDPGSPQNVAEARPGLLMGKISAANGVVAATVGDYGASVIGTVLTTAITSVATSLTISSAAGGAELVRRNGATGTFTLTGPPVASGVVRKLTVTYSAVSASTVTITALGVNAVQTITPTTDGTGGTFSIHITRPDGSTGSTGVLADTASVATIQTALDLASGVANGVVGTTVGAAAPFAASCIALVLTFSGTGFAALPQPLVRFVNTITSNTKITVATTTAGVDGRFVVGSLIGAGDGSELPVTFIPSPYVIRVTDVNNASVVPVPFPRVFVGTNKRVLTASIIGYGTDTSIQAYIKSSLRTFVPGLTFDDDL